MKTWCNWNNNIRQVGCIQKDNVNTSLFLCLDLVCMVSLENPYMNVYNFFNWEIRADVVALDSRTRNDIYFTMYLSCPP